MLKVRSQRSDRPDVAESSFSIISDDPIPEGSWSFRMRPAIWQCLVDFTSRSEKVCFETIGEFLRVVFKDDVFDVTILLANERLE